MLLRKNWTGYEGGKFMGITQETGSFLPIHLTWAQNILVENPSDSVKGLFNKDILCLRWSYALDPCRRWNHQKAPSMVRFSVQPMGSTSDSRVLFIPHVYQLGVLDSSKLLIKKHLNIYATKVSSNNYSLDKSDIPVYKGDCVK